MSIIDRRRCERCGEHGTERRMSLEDGVCIYCRSEEDSMSIEHPNTSSHDACRAHYDCQCPAADLLAALEQIAQEAANTEPALIDQLQLCEDIARAAIAKAVGQAS